MHKLWEYLDGQVHGGWLWRSPSWFQRWVCYKWDKAIGVYDED
jgi:hypothetical protein